MFCAVTEDQRKRSNEDEIVRSLRLIQKKVNQDQISVLHLSPTFHWRLKWTWSGSEYRILGVVAFWTHAGSRKVESTRWRLRNHCMRLSKWNLCWLDWQTGYYCSIWVILSYYTEKLRLFRQDTRCWAFAGTNPIRIHTISHCRKHNSFEQISCFHRTECKPLWPSFVSSFNTAYIR